MAYKKWFEDPKAKAERLGYDLLEPETNEVFVDLDGIREQAAFAVRFNTLKKYYKRSKYRIDASKTEGHAHAIATIPELRPIGKLERLLLQAILGSDPERDNCPPQIQG